MNGWAGLFIKAFPQHVIANMNYRLSTKGSPGFPKQIDDISAAISYLKSKASEYSIEPKFGLMGTSAGGHLSMLYGYGFDSEKDIQVVCNHVGPFSIADPSYTGNQTYNSLLRALVGEVSYAENKTIYEKVSPVTYIRKDSPKTISFFGQKDPLVPYVQALLLDDALDNAGVVNKMYAYQGGHGDWKPEVYGHMLKKLIMFFKNYL